MASDPDSFPHSISQGPAITDVLWTRREGAPAAASSFASLTVPMHLGPTVALCSLRAADTFTELLGQSQPPILIVTSGEGARQLAARLPPEGKFTVLTFSAAAERQLGSDRRIQVQRFTKAQNGQELCAAIAAHPPAGKKALVFAGAAKPAYDIPGNLHRAGIPCQHWPLYETITIAEPSAALSQLARRDDHPRVAVALLSPSAAQGFAAQWRSLFGESPQLPSPRWQAVAIGATTAAAARPFFSALHLAAEPSLPSVIATLTQLAGGSPPVTT